MDAHGIIKAITEHPSVCLAKDSVNAEIIKPDKALAKLNSIIPQLLCNLGYEAPIKNVIYQIREKAQMFTDEEESLDCVDAAKRQWEENLCGELNAMVDEQQRPVAILKDELSKYPPAGTARFLFDSDDFLEAITEVHTPNHSSVITRLRDWGMIKVQLHTHPLDKLREIFEELGPKHRQIGLDDKFEGCEWFEIERSDLCSKLEQKGNKVLLQEFAKQGVPSQHRKVVYRLLATPLGSQLESQEARKNHYYELRKVSKDWILMLDDLFKLDVETTADVDSFFLFEDELKRMMLAFSRDSSIRKECAIVPHSALIGCDRTGDKIGMLPPCGVLPFRGQVLYAAPLCYVFNSDDSESYFVFRHMYTRYWCRLNCLRSRKETILPLCCLFERLLKDTIPQTFFHLVQIGVNPLKIAFPWIHFAFAGHLHPEQVLQLWDRILGFDSLLLIPVLAAAIFVYRSPTLKACKSEQEVKDCMDHLCQLNVVCLLQHFLFSDQVSSSSSNSK
eukprot:TRINITY_DN5296_c0_g1_i1.p1 TRINITY_DN5296_c0_g1~~TRINITY_DN5296_c0_g1_i1.p1  ORF type:complete len:504 (-),score=97.79 TRINITY_DN5296_c0_g1_i1:132-1643(-)